METWTESPGCLAHGFPVGSYLTSPTKCYTCNRVDFPPLFTLCDKIISSSLLEVSLGISRKMEWESVAGMKYLALAIF